MVCVKSSTPCCSTRVNRKILLLVVKLFNENARIHLHEKDELIEGLLGETSIPYDAGQLMKSIVVFRFA
ncbi:MAG: hypothetical protein DWQ10_07205 [Calditrichaeota bacterium]|nr:MAG: hypothetical protein DWQ10_07205 [Calditrichota bacterium]